MTLGYSRFEVERVIRNMDIDDMRVEDIIREGLKQLSKS
jgi:Holliday junction DNA helicase RuvA